MKINPILNKELKLNARTVRMSVIVMVYNLILSCIAVLFFIAIKENYENGNAMNYQELLSLFQILVWVQCIMVCFFVPVLTASSIAGEREKQTLDIMLTTAVRPIQIVVGKLFASLCTVLMLVVSSLPILSVAFVFGGMDWKNILYFVLVIACIAIFIGSVGVFFSSVFKKTTVAIVMTFLLGIALVVGTLFFLPFLKELLDTGVQKDRMNIQWASLLMLINPLVLFLEFTEKSMGGMGVTSLMPLFDIDPTSWYFQFAEKWWLPVSVFIHLFVSVLFLKGSAWFLNPLNQKNRRKKKG